LPQHEKKQQKEGKRGKEKDVRLGEARLMMNEMRHRE